MKLKPCPFCGGEAIMGDTYDVYWITCKHCKAGSMSFHTSKDAIEAWNRREPIDKIVEQLEECKTKKYVTGITHNPYEFGACHAMDDAIEIVKGASNETD